MSRRVARLFESKPLGTLPGEREQFLETFAPINADEAITEGAIFDFRNWVSVRLQDDMLKGAIAAESRVNQRPPTEYRHTVGGDDKPRTLLLLKCDSSLHVPAHLHYGNVNAPECLVHVAALKSCNERFGAELVEISFDTQSALRSEQNGRLGAWNINSPVH